MTKTIYPISDHMIKPLSSGLSAIRVLRDAIHPMSVTEISQAIREPHSQTARILYTLKLEGIVEHDDVLDKYTLVDGVSLKLVLRTEYCDVFLASSPKISGHGPYAYRLPFSSRIERGFRTATAARKAAQKAYRHRNQ